MERVQPFGQLLTPDEVVRGLACPLGSKEPGMIASAIIDRRMRDTCDSRPRPKGRLPDPA
jgi:hypothetical protein